MANKKITELPIASSININDVSVLVNSGTDYQFAFSALLQLISSSLTFGANISFGTTLPQNTTGKNGDVFIKTNTGAFAQKVSGTWTIAYTLPSLEGLTDGTVLYGLGIPGNIIGKNNDTYIDTGTGIFYKKTTDTWAQAFSMQSGPQGPQGIAGTNGTNGTNGFSILSGSTIPSNISTGVDGDFYINTNVWLIYGPKAEGIWPPGVNLALSGSSLKQAYNYTNTDDRFSYDPVDMTLVFSLNADDQLLFPYDGVNALLQASLKERISSSVYKTKTSFDPIITDDGIKYISVMYEGIDSDLINNLQIVLS